MWEELEHYTTFQPIFPLVLRASTAYKKHVEEIQSFEFLVGLNQEYEKVWVNILRNDHLPSLNEVLFHVHREERRQGVMNVSHSRKISTCLFISMGKLWW